MTIKLVVQLLGGVGIFLYSIKLISDSLQLVAGDRLRHLVGMLTRTPLLGVLIGTLVTMLIQSSSATTVMTVSFVDAGLMKLTQAIGVIMGANIGTTVTGPSASRITCIFFCWSGCCCPFSVNSRAGVMWVTASSGSACCLWECRPWKAPWLFCAIARIYSWLSVDRRLWG